MKTTAPKFKLQPGDKQMQAKRQRWNEIQETVKNACDKLGGMAQIGDTHVIVDTRKYNVTAR